MSSDKMWYVVRRWGRLRIRKLANKPKDALSDGAISKFVAEKHLKIAQEAEKASNIQISAPKLPYLNKPAEDLKKEISKLKRKK